MTKRGCEVLSTSLSTRVNRVCFDRHVTLSVDRGIDWDSAVKQFQETGSSKLDGFYCSKREQRGKRLYLLAIQKESSTYLFNITRCAMEIIIEIVLKRNGILAQTKGFTI